MGGNLELDLEESPMNLDLDVDPLLVAEKLDFDKVDLLYLLKALSSKGGS